MVSETDSAERECVIVVMDVNRNKGRVDALDWALKHVVRPKDTVVVVGVIDVEKKNPSCFPKHMGVSISGIWEKLEFSSGHAEVNPRQLGEEIERKREQYQANIQPFFRQCKRNEVKLEVKLAAGLCPEEFTLREAQNCNTRWIVLDRHLKKYKLSIHAHVGCNVAVMKKKDVATLMPSKPTDYSPAGSDERAAAAAENLNLNDQNVVEETESSIPPHHQRPLHWTLGFPREFSLSEIETITNGFAEQRKSQVSEGLLENTPVVVKSFQDDKQFWSMLRILFRVRHRNVKNIIGYCCTATDRFLVYDYPRFGNVEMNLQHDALATNLPWKARWFTAMEIGGCLRYLHEECQDGPIVHLSVSSTSIVYSHGYSANLSNFVTAKWLNEAVPSEDNSTAMVPNPEVDKYLCVDIYDYGILLVELITGRIANWFLHESGGQSLIDWALPSLESGSITEVMDPRLVDSTDDDSRIVQCMARAALLCVTVKGRQCSISEVLAVVGGAVGKTL